MNPFTSGRGRANELGNEESSSRRAGSGRAGSSLVELVVAVAVALVGLLAFTRGMSEALALGQQNRQTALATAAAQAMVERLQAAEPGRAFALYNDEPDDDPDGSGTAPGSRFTAAGLEALAADAGQHGRIFFPTDPGTPGMLREDLADAKLHTPFDLDLDGVVDDQDHAANYRLLPVVVRVAWQEGRNQRQLEVATILGAR